MVEFQKHAHQTTYPSADQINIVNGKVADDTFIVADVLLIDKESTS